MSYSFAYCSFQAMRHEGKIIKTGDGDYIVNIDGKLFGIYKNFRRGERFASLYVIADDAGVISGASSFKQMKAAVAMYVENPSLMYESE